jgi:hypothetical protein
MKFHGGVESRRSRPVVPAMCPRTQSRDAQVARRRGWVPRRRTSRNLRPLFYSRAPSRCRRVMADWVCWVRARGEVRSLSLLLPRPGTRAGSAHVGSQLPSAIHGDSVASKDFGEAVANSAVWRFPLPRRSHAPAIRSARRTRTDWWAPTDSSECARE